MSVTAPSSSANVIPLRSFVVASKDWLKRTQTHPLLTDGPKRFSTALYLNFTYKHYRQTGELLAWPSWDKIEREYGLGKTTIHESIDRLEHSNYSTLSADTTAPPRSESETSIGQDFRR